MHHYFCTALVHINWASNEMSSCLALLGEDISGLPELSTWRSWISLLDELRIPLTLPNRLGRLLQCPCSSIFRPPNSIESLKCHSIARHKESSGLRPEAAGHHNWWKAKNDTQPKNGKVWKNWACRSCFPEVSLLDPEGMPDSTIASNSVASLFYTADDRGFEKWNDFELPEWAAVAVKPCPLAEI